MAFTGEALFIRGKTVPGPAIIAEDETSTLVNRHYDAHVLATGYLSLEWKS
jgi:hypothetical protein